MLFVLVWNLVSHIMEKKIWIQSIWEQGAEEDVWTSEGGRLEQVA
jgi:hypothetical protein